jgi:hypothetical protein
MNTSDCVVILVQKVKEEKDKEEFDCDRYFLNVRGNPLSHGTHERRKSVIKKTHQSFTFSGT